MNKSYKEISAEGFYGDFGGSYIPEALQKNIDELREAYHSFGQSAEFRKEFNELLRDYVGRPSPLYFSKKLSDKYNAKVYLKREELNFTGAHKINNTLGQILLAKYLGKKRVIAETGAGQHGVATATVCALLNMECLVYMGSCDIERQHFNVRKMEMLGARVVEARGGSQTLTDAVDAALAAWCADPESYYLIGSAVGPHPYPEMVADFQSVISSEIRTQLEGKEGRQEPDYVLACIGGGSNAVGAFYHFIDSPAVALVAAEAGGLGAQSGHTAATMTVGQPAVLHGSRTMVITNDKGEAIEPYSISAGLDYPGVGPLPAHLAACGRMRVVSVNDDEALRAALNLTRSEGIIPALESAHALAALEHIKDELTLDKIVVVNLSGRGDKDVETYLKHL